MRFVAGQGAVAELLAGRCAVAESDQEVLLVEALRQSCWQADVTWQRWIIVVQMGMLLWSKGAKVVQVDMM